jgi:hypothetical protein
MPDKRLADCPAVPVCDVLGNTRKSCKKGGLISANDEMMVQRCIAGLILLIAPLAGVKLPVLPDGPPPELVIRGLKPDDH